MSKYNLDVFGFMETRVNPSRAHKIVNRIDLPNFVEIPWEVSPVKFGCFEK